MDKPECQLIVCVNTRLTNKNPSCGARGSEIIADELEYRCKALNLPIVIERFLCLGDCQNGPNMRLAPSGQYFNDVSTDDIPMVMQAIHCFLAEMDT